MVGDVCILLGSDLEEDKNNGWSSILNSDVRPKKKASLFKIPHHGSKRIYPKYGLEC